MSNDVFLFKENGSNDRDCVHYIRTEDLIDCYIGFDKHFHVCGPCFSMSLKGDIPYEEITTILTKEEYEQLCNPQPDSDFSRIAEKLQGEENKALFDKIVQEEKEWLCEEYGLSEKDVDEIFDNYASNEYRDRGVVACVYADEYELGFNEAWDWGWFNKSNDPITKYLDFEELGADLVNEANYYYRIKDGRIVCLNV